MHSSVFVVKNDWDDGPYCSKSISAGLPADCEYATEIPLDNVKAEAIAEMFQDMEPVVVKNGAQFDVTIKTEMVRKYLLAVTLYTKRLLDRFASSLIGKAGKSAPFYRAANALRDPYGLRIMDESQDDLHTWLTEKLAEADREEKEFISFTVVQAFEYRF